METTNNSNVNISVVTELLNMLSDKADIKWIEIHHGIMNHSILGLCLHNITLKNKEISSYELLASNVYHKIDSCESDFGYDSLINELSSYKAAIEVAEIELDKLRVLRDDLILNQLIN